MTKQSPEEVFCLKNRISTADWEKSGCTWEELQAIHADHTSRLTHLENAADGQSKLVLAIPQVHSVRWRVKDADHVVEKIIRKRAEGSEKYRSITVANYFEVIHDLVGVRALHLFKDEWLPIHEYLTSELELAEDPVAYIREGDLSELKESFESRGLKVKVHKQGYRSIHYIAKSVPQRRTVFSEIQVRTIFEEGWSEIDHKVRYPNFSNDSLVGFFLTIFNRLAGSADEMGSFVQGLAASQTDLHGRIAESERQKEEVLGKMNALLEDLGKLEKKHERSEQQIAKAAKTISDLKLEMTKLQALATPTINLAPSGLEQLAREYGKTNWPVEAYLAATARRVPPGFVEFGLVPTPTGLSGLAGLAGIAGIGGPLTIQPDGTIKPKDK